MTHKELHGKTIRESFIEFNKNNPEVLKKFTNMALGAIRKGRTKLSSKLIINVIRWEYYMKTDDANFKINDAYHAYYGRLFAREHPQYRDYFTFRKLRTEEPGPYMLNLDGQYQFE